MKYKTFDTQKNDATSEPMFLGNPVNVARYDKQKYVFFEKQIKKQLSFYWVPEEIAMNQDAANFHKQLGAAEQHIFTSNLYYQILLDSVQGRAPNVALLPYCSLPELETLVETWSFFETIHSRSYTHIIRGIYTDPTKMLDGILDIQEIVSRATAVTKYYDDFIEYGNWYNMLGEGTFSIKSEDGTTKTITVDKKELQKKLYLMVVAINILEGVRFYVSFACTWAFAESMKVMEKSAKIIKMICRDENVHLAITSHILKKWQDGSEGKEMQEIAAECEQEVYTMYNDAVEQEKAWADYLFKDGSIVGLNAEILKDYVVYIASRRMKAIGLKPISNNTSNPLPWTTHWIGSKDGQPALQEEENTSYLVGAVKKDADKDSFSSFEL